MKKKYIKPFALLIDTDSCNVICASVEYGGEGDGRAAEAPMFEWDFY